MDRVLSQTAHLRRFSRSFFIPLEPYPARSARHLPHAGKALSVVILFLHISCIRFDDSRKAASSFRSLPHWGRGTASAVDRVLSYIVDLRRISPLIFHTARTLSGSLCSPPSPRGEGFVSGTPLSPSNLRPFGAPPSIGRREHPREPLLLEGATERSEAGLAFFFCGEAASSLPSPLGKALYRENPHSHFAASPLGIASPYAQ